MRYFLWRCGHLNSNTATEISMAYFVTVTKMTTNTSTLVALLPKYRKAKHIVFLYRRKKKTWLFS